MVDLALRSLRFRREREDSWKRLETLLRRVEGGGAGKLSDEELVELPALYRAALSALSVARATSLDAALIDYLEALCARAYFFVYGARSSLRERTVAFFARDWPEVVRAMWKETLVAALITLAAALAAFFLTSSDPDWFYAFVDGDMAQGRTPAASEAELRATLYDQPEGTDGLSAFAAFLFTHNAGVALFAFALGFAFCVPSALFMVYNGVVLGAMFSVFHRHGLAEEFAAWLLIHGITELLAIFIAGAAGFRIGWAVAFPGARTRLHAAEAAGRQGGAAMLGVVVMLFLAGIIEGIGRQTIVEDWARWSIAGATLLIWLRYFYVPGPRRQERAHG